MSTHDITAPIPGTWFVRESPASDPFVSVGDTVEVGQTVGLVEVMKMFNPVTADVAGTVAEILVESEDVVDAGQPLVRIEVP